jgi:ribosomal protein S18 acetylase RimI-like enzyme
MTIGILAPFRRHGLASVLLKRIIHEITKDQTVMHLCLHVHVVNEEALGFYLKHGFIIEKVEEGYYARNRGVEPPDGKITFE